MDPPLCGAETASSESPEASQDLISSMPPLVTTKILKRLPLSMAAKTSILSRTWREIWLSQSYLTFDEAFWKEQRKDDGIHDWQEASKIISNILFHHNGRLKEFHLLLVPQNAEILLSEKSACLSQWLSLLSRTCPQKIILINYALDWSSLLTMPSYIFRCTELVKLMLQCFISNPPYNFKGFAHLRTLELAFVKFNTGIGILWTWVPKCPSLSSLMLVHCLDMDLLEVESASLEKLIILGTFKSICIKKVPRLTDVSLMLHKPNVESAGSKTVVDTIISLTTSFELLRLEINGNLCKFLVAGGIAKRLPGSYNHLRKLCLMDLDLSNFDVFSCTLGMVQSCPFIQDLEFSVIMSSNNVEQKFEYPNDNFKLGKLRKAKITGITGSSAELKLVEYVLAISVALEKMLFKFGVIDANSEVKLAKELMRFPRASIKAQLLCSE